jgi:SAM-dependent methyltransferase
MQHWSMSHDRRLRATFDRAASLYQDARPDYPAELYSDLIAITGLEPPAHLLEVGCGPGKATLPLARMGFRITAIELGAALAAEARHRLAEFADISVITSSFEGWEPPTGATFDLVYAATAWKWVDSEVKYAKAAALLVPRRPLGRLGRRPCVPQGLRSVLHRDPTGLRRDWRRRRQLLATATTRRPARPHRHRIRDLRTLHGHRDTALPMGPALHRGRIHRPAEHLLWPHRHGARQTRTPLRRNTPPPRRPPGWTTHPTLVRRHHRRPTLMTPPT